MKIDKDCFIDYRQLSVILMFVSFNEGNVGNTEHDFGKIVQITLIYYPELFTVK